MNIEEISSQLQPKPAAADAAARSRGQQVIAMALVLVVMLGAGAFGVWKLVSPSNRLPDEPLVDVPGGGGPGNFVFRQEPAQPRDGVRRTGNTHTLRADQNVMVATEKDGKWSFSYRYQPAKYSSPSHSRFLTAKYQTMALKLTDEQKQALNALPAYVSGMALSDDDRKTLETQWNDYVTAGNAEKPARERTLVETLKQVGERSVPATLAAGDAYIAKIKAVLTSEQIEMLENPKR